jgi:hypothetical protein
MNGLHAGCAAAAPTMPRSRAWCLDPQGSLAFGACDARGLIGQALASFGIHGKVITDQGSQYTAWETTRTVLA